MLKLINKSKFLYVFAILAFSFSYTTSYIEAQSSDKPKKQIKYKKVETTFIAHCIHMQTNAISTWFDKPDSTKTYFQTHGNKTLSTVDQSKRIRNGRLHFSTRKIGKLSTKRRNRHHMIFTNRSLSNHSKSLIICAMRLCIMAAIML